MSTADDPLAVGWIVLRDYEYIKEIIPDTDLPPGTVIGIEANERTAYQDGALYVIAKRPRRWFRR